MFIKDSDLISEPIETNTIYKVCFFAGGETRDDKFNNFTGSFIGLMKEIIGVDFRLITGIYLRTSMMNVIWALNHAQKPISHPEKKRITSAAFRQIVSDVSSPDIQLLIISSSTGSVVAAQTACFLAEKNRNNPLRPKPFHLVLGASMISPDSELYCQLIQYQREGLIGTILHEEIQDEGDTSFGAGGRTRSEAYRNAFGLMFPFLSGKFSGPSFLNTNPKTGHLHRKRSQSILKAYDYINIILVRHNLAGVHYCKKAVSVLKGKIT